MDTLERQIAQRRERREIVIPTDGEIRGRLTFPDCMAPGATEA
jgi:hypothetical protein